METKFNSYYIYIYFLTSICCFPINYWFFFLIFFFLNRLRGCFSYSDPFKCFLLTIKIVTKEDSFFVLVLINYPAFPWSDCHHPYVSIAFWCSKSFTFACNKENSCCFESLAGDCIQCVYFRRGKKGIYNLVVMSSKMNSNAKMQDDMHRNTLYFKCGLYE